MGYLSNIIISWYRQNIVNCWGFRVKAMGGLLWQSSGWDSTLPMQEARV